MLWLRAEDIAERIPTDSRGFVLLCNDLLRAFADRHEIDRSHLDLSEQTTTPDGGVDGRCMDAPLSHGRLIPAANVMYQFKGGATKKSAADVAKKDVLKKDKVVAGLKAGLPFIYLARWRREAGFEQEVTKEVRNGGLQVADGQIIFIDGYDIAGLLDTFPGVLAKHIGGIAPFLSLDEWGQLGSLQNQFCSNADLDARLEEIARAIEEPSSRVRIVGAGGNGKTRSVHEAIRRSVALDLTVLYSPDPDGIGFEVLDALTKADAIECTVVVDEASFADHELLADRFGPMKPGVRLVTIGRDASLSPGQGIAGEYVIPGLEDSLLIEAMSLQAEGAPEEAIREAADACRGSPKLALLVAEQMKREPTLATAAAALSDRSVRAKLDHYLRIDINDPEWEPIAVVSLLDRVGWSEDLDHESETLFTAAGLDVSDARRHVRSVGERHGIAQKTRRLLYVSPQLLADHLAIRWLEDQTSAALRAFYEGLTPPLQDRLGKRIRRIAQMLENRSAVVEVILGPKGPFQSLADIEGNPIASLLPRLAGPLRHPTSEALTRIIAPATDEQLTAAVSARRVLVTAITELLWWEDTFRRVAPLLLRLAVNENETWGNNASGIWVECFQTTLGRTEADFEVRAEVLGDGARSSDSRARALTAKALGAAVGRDQSRMGMPPEDVPDAPKEAWHPATHGEFTQAIRTYLELLRALLSDAETGVRIEAVTAFRESAWHAYRYPTVFETWADIARKLVDREFDERAMVVERIDWVLARGRDELESDKAKESPDLTKRVQDALAHMGAVRESLLGDDFSSRLRRAVEADPWRLQREDSDWTEEVQPVLDEILVDPSLLDDEWHWLLEREGSGPERLMAAVGTRDTKLVFDPTLRRLAEEHTRAVRWMSLYLVNRHKEGDAGDLIDERLEEFTADDTRHDWALDLLTLLPAEEERVELLVTLFEGGKLAASQLPRLQFSLLLEAMSPDQIVRLLEAARGESDTEAYCLGLLHYYLYRRPAEAPHLTEAALQVLRSPPTSKVRRGGHSLDYEWSEIAKRYVDDHPLEVARAALHWVETTEAFRPYGFPEVIQTARKTAGDEAFFTEVSAPWLAREDFRSRLFGDDVIEPSSLLALDPEVVIRWVAEEPDVRAHRVARVLGAPIGETVSPLHGHLLEEFEEHGVGSAFFSDLVTGSWTGSLAARTRGLLDGVRRWVDDERPAVRSWVKKAVADLEHMLDREEMYEEEEPFEF